MEIVPGESLRRGS